MSAYIIKYLHILLVLFIILTPFIGSPYLLSMHLLIVPFIMIHWITNQSVCALTEMEKILSGKTDDDETFFGQLVGPVYKFKTKDDENLFMWALLIALWFITFFRLKNTDFSYLRVELHHVFTRLRTLTRRRQ